MAHLYSTPYRKGSHFCISRTYAGTLHGEHEARWYHNDHRKHCTGSLYNVQPS